MDWVSLGVVHRAAVINRVASDVKKPAKHGLTHWYADRTASIGYAHSALQPFGRRHRDGAHPVIAEVLLDLQGELRWLSVNLVFKFQRVVDFRQPFSVRKFDVHHGTNHLNYVSFIHKIFLPRERHLRRGNLE